MSQPAGVFEAPADLPEDPAALQAILRAALAEIERLRFQLAGLQRNSFGRRSEKLADETVQQASEDLEQSVAEKMAALEAAAKARTRPSAGKPAKRNRGALPAHLPRVEVMVVSGQIKRNELHTLLPWNWKPACVPATISSA
jgi:transposase